MRTLKTSEAASYLNVSPNTLRAWERRFGYPTPMRTEGKHRLYTHGEIAALRDALKEGLSISSAVSRARENLTADTPMLVGALTACELDRADAAMEAALALRSVERAVEEVLLPSLHEIADRHGDASAPWAFAAGWATDWLVRARRMAPSPARPLTVLVGDATDGELDPAALDAAALHLFLGRAGAQTLSLPGHRPDGPLRRPGELPSPRDRDRRERPPRDDDVARWAYAVRSATGPLPVALFRRGERRASGRTTGTVILHDSLAEATREVQQLLDERRPAAAPVRPAAFDTVPLRRSATA